ncbi:hypothetical protein N9P64_01325 [bacterium]|nr:hypothetical protein [bacterium]MDA9361250.1 hypothetical protein [Flavobacteriaceae bacterium]
MKNNCCWNAVDGGGWMEVTVSIRNVGQVISDTFRFGDFIINTELWS